MLRKVGRKATFYMLKYVKNNCKGGKNMDNTRRIYLDNIRWITVCIVVIYQYRSGETICQNESALISVHGTKSHIRMTLTICRRTDVRGDTLGRRNQHE